MPELRARRLVREESSAELPREGRGGADVPSATASLGRGQRVLLSQCRVRARPCELAVMSQFQLWRSMRVGGVGNPPAASWEARAASVVVTVGFPAQLGQRGPRKQPPEPSRSPRNPK